MAGALSAVGWAIVAVLAAILGAPFVAERRRPGPVRGTADRRAALPSGTTRYRWHGPSRGPVAVLIHGIATPLQIWETLADGLVATSFRVLSYDLYGRGLSDAPGGPQDAAFFVRQLEELLAHEGIEGDLTVIGFSMGGAIATAFADRHPDRMTRLVLIAPAGIEGNKGGERTLNGVMRRVPVLGDWLHGIVGPLRARAGARGTAAVADARRAQAARRGYFPSLLASRRGILAARQKDTHRRIGAQDVPVLAIWGNLDTSVPISALGTLAQWNRNARHEVIEAAGHELLTTHPDAVAAALRRLLRD